MPDTRPLENDQVKNTDINQEEKKEPNFEHIDTNSNLEIHHDKLEGKLSDTDNNENIINKEMPEQNISSKNTVYNTIKNTTFKNMRNESDRENANTYKKHIILIKDIMIKNKNNVFNENSKKSDSNNMKINDIALKNVENKSDQEIKNMKIDDIAFKNVENEPEQKIENMKIDDIPFKNVEKELDHEIINKDRKNIKIDDIASNDDIIIPRRDIPISSDTLVPDNNEPALEERPLNLSISNVDDTQKDIFQIEYPSYFTDNLKITDELNLDLSTPNYQSGYMNIEKNPLDESFFADSTDQTDGSSSHSIQNDETEDKHQENKKKSSQTMSINKNENQSSNHLKGDTKQIYFKSNYINQGNEGKDDFLIDEKKNTINQNRDKENYNGTGKNNNPDEIHTNKENDQNALEYSFNLLDKTVFERDTSGDNLILSYIYELFTTLNQKISGNGTIYRELLFLIQCGKIDQVRGLLEMKCMDKSIVDSMIKREKMRELVDCCKNNIKEIYQCNEGNRRKVQDIAQLLYSRSRENILHKEVIGLYKSKIRSISEIFTLSGNKNIKYQSGPKCPKETEQEKSTSGHNIELEKMRIKETISTKYRRRDHEPTLYTKEGNEPASLMGGNCTPSMKSRKTENEKPEIEFQSFANDVVDSPKRENDVLIGMNLDELTNHLEWLCNRVKSLKRELENWPDKIVGLKNENEQLREDLTVLAQEYYRMKEERATNQKLILDQRRIINILQNNLSVKSDRNILADLKCKIEVYKVKWQMEENQNKKREYYELLKDYEKRLNDFLIIERMDHEKL